jgi:hypothetical protein
MFHYKAAIIIIGGALVCACSSAPELAPAAQAPKQPQSIESLVAAARLDAAKKPRVAEALMRGPVLVIPSPHDSTPGHPVLLKFAMPEYEFIPVFSDRSTFDQEAQGTGFEGQAISIDAKAFASLLSDGDVVIVNPGHRPAMEFKASEIRQLVPQSR